MLRTNLGCRNQREFLLALRYKGRPSTASQWERQKADPGESVLQLMSQATENPQEVFAWLKDGGTMPTIVPTARFTERLLEIRAAHAVQQGVGRGGETSEEDPYEMLAQWMVNHWNRIAGAHEITGPDLIPLLERELEWFRENEYTDAYDATLDLIRSIRFFIKHGRQQGRNGDGDMPPAA